jgi:hypothetical protein
MLTRRDLRPAVVLLLCYGPCWADQQPIDLSVQAAQEVVLGMPLDVRIVATSRVDSAFATPLCAAVLVRQDGDWTAHREDDGSFEQGVLGGFIRGADGADPNVGRPYDFKIRVHLEKSAYGQPRLALERPGLYRLRAAYFPNCRFNDPRKFSAVSNEIVVRVSRPKGSDRVAFERAVREQPGLLEPRVAAITDPDGEKRAALAKRYPRSVYAPLWRARR